MSPRESQFRLYLTKHFNIEYTITAHILFSPLPILLWDALHECFLLSNK